MKNKDCHCGYAHGGPVSSGSLGSIGPDEWVTTRAAHYRKEAHALLAVIERYEHDHPADAPCLAPVLGAIAAILPERHR